MISEARTLAVRGAPARDAWLEVREGSELAAYGTEEKPIVLTSDEEAPGSWGGVAVLNGQAGFEHVTIEYAGAPIPGVDLYPDEGTAALVGGGEVTIDHTTLRRNAGYALADAPNLGFPSLELFANNTITARARATARRAATSAETTPIDANRASGLLWCTGGATWAQCPWHRAADGLLRWAHRARPCHD
jgi:hypothetical protein